MSFGIHDDRFTKSHPARVIDDHCGDDSIANRFAEVGYLVQFVFQTQMSDMLSCETSFRTVHWS